MMQPILGLIRHILTFVGGYFVASGDIADADVSAFAGAVATIIGIIWSVVNKRQKIPGVMIAPLLAAGLLAFSLVPGCVRGPDGNLVMDPSVSVFLKSAAEAATIAGVYTAAGAVHELTPFLPRIVSSVRNAYAQKDTPTDIGSELRQLFTEIALEIGNDELDAVLAEYVADALVPKIPAADAHGGSGQYQFNAQIRDAFRD